MKKVTTEVLQRVATRVHLVHDHGCQHPEGCEIIDAFTPGFSQAEQSYAAQEIVFLRTQAEAMAIALEMLDHMGVRGHTTKYREAYPKEDNEQR